MYLVRWHPPPPLISFGLLCVICFFPGPSRADPSNRMASFAVSLVMLLYGPGGVVVVAPFSLAAGFVVFANVHSLVELAPEDDGEHGRGAIKAKAD